MNHNDTKVFVEQPLALPESANYVGQTVENSGNSLRTGLDFGLA